ncbi:MAG: glycosyltransferase family 39 protein [Thermomicrobiales bacterium]
MAGTATATGRKGASRRAKSRGKRGIAGLFAGVRVGDLELLLVVCLFGMAILMRWPNLLRLPHFTDEIGEIRWALRIYRGEEFPLTGQVKYFGPLQHYLLAATFKIFGLAIIIPRLLVCIIGGLTVVLTYFVGREVGGWKVGALGAALLATLPQHIVVNSHVAWQNSTTPFYSTLAAYAVLRAVRAFPEADASRVPRWARWLLLGGFVFGLMFHPHIGRVVLAPALGGGFVWGCGGRTLPRRCGTPPLKERGMLGRGGGGGGGGWRPGERPEMKSPGYEMRRMNPAPWVSARWCQNPRRCGGGWCCRRGRGWRRCWCRWRIAR